MSSRILNAVVVGCRGIGKLHATALSKAHGIELVGLCDSTTDHAVELAAGYPGVRIHADYARMLDEVRPDIVALGVPTDLHAAMAVQAARAGVAGICGEKPMARNLAEARDMIQACEKEGARLIVNHQRRTYPAMIVARKLVEQAAIGEVRLIRASCPGDILTDGTHAIDSVRYLAGDAEAAWVMGSVYRRRYAPDEKAGKGCVIRDGRRYRHGCPIEDGGMGVWEFDNGVRAELFCGAMRVPGRSYQDYEIIGSTGVLWRRGDNGDPNLLLRTDTAAGWQPVSIDDHADGTASVARNYELLARNILTGSEEHPLSAQSAIKTLEIIMATYESSRLGERIELPLDQDRYPMDIIDTTGGKLRPVLEEEACV